MTAPVAGIIAEMTRDRDPVEYASVTIWQRLVDFGSCSPRDVDLSSELFVAAIARLKGDGWQLEFSTPQPLFVRAKEEQRPLLEQLRNAQKWAQENRVALLEQAQRYRTETGRLDPCFFSQGIPSGRLAS